MNWRELNPDEMHPYFKTYVSQLPEGNLLELLAGQPEILKRQIDKLGEEGVSFRYAPDKWSVKEVLVHLLDAERIFLARALRFARGDQADLPGFDQNEYAREIEVGHLKIAELWEEYLAQRKATVLFFKNLPEKVITRRGRADGNFFSVRAIANIIAGHERHHINLIENRYLPAFSEHQVR